eukprot:scaffold1920_cov97-Skeletonema_dohrnii-CCMP3373.AAC.4
MILRRRHAAIATAALLCPHDVHGAHHHGHAFVSSSIIDAATNKHHPSQRSRLEYSKDHEDNVNIWLPTEHAAAASAKTSHGWDNFPSADNTEIDDDNYNIIDDWVDAKQRRSRRLQSLDDVNVENSKKLNYRAREQEKVEEWRRSRNDPSSSATSSPLPPPPQSLIDEHMTNNKRNQQSSSSVNRLDLPYNDISQLSAIQSNAPAILLPSGPGTGKSHVLSLRIAYLLQKWVQHWQQRQQTITTINTAANDEEQSSFPMGGEEVCSPDSMIILSFTNNDALRLKERALDYLYPTADDTMMRNQTSKALWSGTMHAFSLAILNKYTSSAAPPLRVLPAREMKNRVAASLRSLLDGGSTNANGDGSNNSNTQTEGWYRELQLRHIQTLNDVGHSRSILFQNIVRCIDLWKEANMPLASADNHFTIKRDEGDGSDVHNDDEEEGVRSDCVELAIRLGIPKSSALLALDVFPEYQARHAVAGTVDPSDLAGMAYRHLLENPKSLHLIRSKLKHIIVDEYQDMSVSQHALLRLVVRGVVGDEDIVPSNSNNVAKRKKLPILLDAMDLNEGYKSAEEASYSVPSLFCAGDSSQSIYGWRGAAPLLTVDGFRKDFPQGVVAPLDVCYRLPTDILDAANMLLPSEPSRGYQGTASQTTTTFDVSPAAAAKVASNVSGSSSSTSDQTRGNTLLGNELLLSKGMKKLDSTVLIHGLWDDRDEAKYIAATIRRRSKDRRKALLKALRNLDDNISVAQEKELLDLTDVAVLVRSSKQMNLLEEALAKAGIPFTVAGRNDGEGPTAALVQRKRSGKEEMIPMKPVTIMTMHKAKGEEFDDIYLAGWTEGEFPHPEAMSSNRVHEERRLAYVALTRARQRIVITHSFMNRKLHFGKDGAKRFVSSQVAPSRFLYELVPSKKHMDGLANKNEVLGGDNVGTFWDRSAGIKDYVAGTNIPQWFQKSFEKPAGYVSRREDVRLHTNILEEASMTKSTRQSEKVTTTFDLPNEISLASSQAEVAKTSASLVTEKDETESTDSTTDMSVDYSSMTVSQLKHILRSKGLKVSGRKAVLIERLESDSASSAVSIKADVTEKSSVTVEQLDHILRRKGLKVGAKEEVLIERLKSENIPVEKSLLGYLSMTVVQIKNILRSNGLKVSGRKAVLVERVASSLSNFRRS